MLISNNLKIKIHENIHKLRNGKVIFEDLNVSRSLTIMTGARKLQHCRISYEFLQLLFINAVLDDSLMCTTCNIYSSLVSDCLAIQGNTKNVTYQDKSTRKVIKDICNISQSCLISTSYSIHNSSIIICLLITCFQAVCVPHNGGLHLFCSLELDTCCAIHVCQNFVSSVRKSLAYQIILICSKP